MKFRRSRLAPLVVGCSLLVACGPSSGGNRSSVSANANTFPNGAAGVVARANEPRQNDPTGSNPAPMGVSTGLSANITGVAPTPPPSSSKKKADPADEKAEPGSEGPTDPTSSPKGPAADPATPKRIGARHVLVQWMGSERAPASVVRSREQALTVAKEVLKRARAGDDFARLAIEFSDEPGAGGRGGSLGRFGHGQMVGAFEAAAFKLSIGQISDIVESPFGYHIIQRTE